MNSIDERIVASKIPWPKHSFVQYTAFTQGPIVVGPEENFQI